MRWDESLRNEDAVVVVPCVKELDKRATGKRTPLLPAPPSSLVRHELTPKALRLPPLMPPTPPPPLSLSGVSGLVGGLA